MILYTVYDKSKHTFSYPLVAPDAATAESALKTINPENLSDLIILIITTLTSLADLLCLRPDPNVDLIETYPTLYNRSDSTESQGQAEGATPHET